MAEYEALIAIKDEADHNDTKRKKEGDIITVREKGHKWGRKELDEHMAVPFESSKTLNELRELIMIKAADGSKRKFKIPLSDLKTNYLGELDLAKVADSECKYQPFLCASECCDLFDDISTEDMDCGTQSETYIPTADNPNDLIYNKDGTAFVAPNSL